MTKEQMIAYLQSKGVVNVNGRDGERIPLKQVKMKQLCGVYYTYLRIAEKKKRHPVVVKEQQLTWNF